MLVLLKPPKMGPWLSRRGQQRKQNIEQKCIASNLEGIAEFAIPIGDDLRTILSALGDTYRPMAMYSPMEALGTQRSPLAC